MTTIYDDFSTDPLGTRWGTLWAGNSETYDAVNDDWDLSQYGAYHTTQLSTLINYVKVTLVSRGGDDAGEIVLRSTGTGSDGYYGIQFEFAAETTAYLTYNYHVGWVADLASAGSTTINSNDTLAATITGTSTGTIIRCWVNTTNNSPVAVDGWDSAGDTCDFSFSAAGGWSYYCDTGKYVGLFNQVSSTNTYDNFYAGDIEESSSSSSSESSESSASSISSQSSTSSLSSESSISSTSSLSSESSLSSDSSTSLNPNIGCFIWGEENPVLQEIPISWSVWSDGAAGSPTIDGDSDWGRLKLSTPAIIAQSDVKDLKTEENRLLTITQDVYEAGAGTTKIYIRGQAASFNQDDGSPSWELYSAPVQKTWRYFQIRIVAV